MDKAFLKGLTYNSAYDLYRNKHVFYFKNKDKHRVPVLGIVSGVHESYNTFKKGSIIVLEIDSMQSPYETVRRNCCNVIFRQDDAPQAKLKISFTFARERREEEVYV